MKKDRNIRIYKNIFPDGSILYTSKENDDRNNKTQSTIKGIARETGSYYKEIKTFAQFTIDFKPYHDIECPGALAPRRCIALAEDEIVEFWRYFKNFLK